MGQPAPVTHLVGWAQEEILVRPTGLAMNGYGRADHRATGATTPSPLISGMGGTSPV